MSGVANVMAANPPIPKYNVDAAEALLDAQVDALLDEWPVDRVEPDIAPRSENQSERIADIRREIAAGTYLTQDKLEATADKLHDMLRAELTAKRHDTEAAGF